MGKRLAFLTLGLVVLCATGAFAQIVDDAFASDSSANYSLLSGGTSGAWSTGGTYTAQFGYDYSSDTDSSGGAIPSAPNTGDSSKTCLKTVVNGSGGDATMLTIYPDISAITGSYRIRVDLFPRKGDGDNGTTENYMLGINCGGSKVIGFGDFGSYSDNVPDDTDGYLFGGTIDGGFQTIDLAFFEGNDTALDPATLNADGSNGFQWEVTADSTNSGMGEDDQLAQNSAFPTASGYVTAGMPYGKWSTFEIENNAGTITVKINSQAICSYDDPDDTFSGGIPGFSHSDLYDSQATNGAFYWDNLLIENLSSVENWELF